MLDVLTAEDFEAVKGQALTLAQGDAAIAVEVAEVRRLTSPSPRAQPFSVVLRHRGAKGAAGQGTYRLTLPQGPIDLFLVPVGPDREGMCYEAVFN